MYSYVRFKSCANFQKTYPLDNNHSLNIYDDLHPLPIDTVGKSTGQISIAFGSPGKSKNLLMFALFSRTVNQKDVLQYRVGFGFNNNSGQPSKTWGPKMEINLSHHQTSTSFSAYTMAAGDIRQIGSDDLILIYESYEYINKQRKTTTYYNSLVQTLALMARFVRDGHIQLRFRIYLILVMIITIITWFVLSICNYPSLM